MPVSNHPRRTFLAQTALLGAAVTTSPLAPSRTTAAEPQNSDDWPASRNAALQRLKYCLNTSTINGGKVPVREQLKIAAEAGYDSVELWLRDVESFVAGGGKLSDLASEIKDLGLSVDSAIAFGKWIVDDEAERAAGLLQCRKDMETLRAIGGTRIAAPPVGATQKPGLNLSAAADRYRELLEIGVECDVVPQIELWGFSANMSTLAEVLYVAAAAEHPQSCILLDVYHMYKGGSDFANVGLVPAQQMHCLHMNDYPAEPNRQKISDQDRVYPGRGVAPISKILSTLVDGGFQGTLSLELFNREYWSKPPLEVAKTGLESMRAAVAAAK